MTVSTSTKILALWWVVVCKSPDCGETRSTRAESDRPTKCCMCGTHNTNITETQKWECKKCGLPTYQDDEPEKCRSINKTSCESCSQLSASVNISEESLCDCPGYIENQCDHQEFIQSV